MAARTCYAKAEALFAVYEDLTNEHDAGRPSNLFPEAWVGKTWQRT